MEFSSIEVVDGFFLEQISANFTIDGRYSDHQMFHTSTTGFDPTSWPNSGKLYVFPDAAVTVSDDEEPSESDPQSTAGALFSLALFSEVSDTKSAIVWFALSH